MWKKTENAMDVMRERNRRYLESKDKEKKEKTPPESGGPDPDEGCAEQTAAPENTGGKGREPDEGMKLEKGDVPAMILSAILVFGPVFLVLFGIFALAWIFLH